MARSRDKMSQALHKKAELLSNPGTPYGLKVSLMGRSKQFGYLGKLNRNRKKCGGQLKGLPGCGPSIKDDFIVGY